MLLNKDFREIAYRTVCGSLADDRRYIVPSFDMHNNIIKLSYLMSFLIANW